MPKMVFKSCSYLTRGGLHRPAKTTGDNMYSLDTRDPGFRTIIQQSAHRVDRGGSWLNGGDCRSAYRGGDSTSIRFISLGFRTVIKV